VKKERKPDVYEGSAQCLVDPTHSHTQQRTFKLDMNFYLLRAACATLVSVMSFSYKLFYLNYFISLTFGIKEMFVVVHIKLQNYWWKARKGFWGLRRREDAKINGI